MIHTTTATEKNGSFDKKLIRFLLKLFALAFFSEVALYWIQQRGVYEGLNLPAAMLSPGIGWDAVTAPAISLLDRLTGEASVWQNIALYFFILLSGIRLLISLTGCHANILGQPLVRQY